MFNVILIDHEPFTKRRKELFFIQNFIDEGFHVQVWDISRYLYKSVHIVDTIEHEDYVTQVIDYNQLCHLLAGTDIRNTVFFVEFFDIWKSRLAQQLLSDYHCFTIRMDLFANTTLHESVFRKFKRLFSPLFLEIVQGKLTALFISCYKKLYQVKGVNRYLSSSSLVKRTDKINHPDYENYRFKKHPPILHGKYIVFCDVFFPFHPDLVYYCNRQNLPDGKKYQETMRHFFDYMEKTYNMPVVIAAHPKADYNGDEFGKRRIIKYQTDNLVLNANMVVLHNSNSVSYSVLANKPIAFITTNEYESVPRLGPELSLLASTLKKHVYNLDKIPFNAINITTVENLERKNYIYTYLTSPEIEDRKNWEIIREVVIKGMHSL